MKAILLATVLALTPASQVIIETDGGVFIAQTETVAVGVNELGHQQVEMTVHLSTAAGVSTNRVGVVGCKHGRGLIARVGPGGAPIASPVQWQAHGTKVHDALAATICAAVKHPGSQARPKEMV